MKRSNRITISWIALVVVIVGAILEIVVWRDWVSFGFDVVAILGITHFLFRILRRSSGDNKEKDRAKS